MATPIIHPLYKIFPQSSNSKIITNDNIVSSKKTQFVRSSDSTFDNAWVGDNLDSFMASNLINEKEYYQYIHNKIQGNPYLTLLILPSNFKFNEIKYYDEYLTDLESMNLRIVYEYGGIYTEHITTLNRTLIGVIMESTNKLLLYDAGIVEYIIGVKEIIAIDINCKIDSKDFLYTSNTTHINNNDLYITKLGIYDIHKNLIAVSTFSQPIKRLKTDFSIVININVYNE